MSRLIDISPPVGRGAVVWPGDTPFELEVAWSPEHGDAVTVSRVTMSPHTGAHADAPLHVGAGPGDAATLPLAGVLGAVPRARLAGGNRALAARGDRGGRSRGAGG